MYGVAGQLLYDRLVIDAYRWVERTHGLGANRALRFFKYSRIIIKRVTPQIVCIHGRSIRRNSATANFTANNTTGSHSRPAETKSYQVRRLGKMSPALSEGTCSTSQDPPGGIGRPGQFHGQENTALARR